jgi:uncharacterized protein (TIGR02145 family)
MKKLSIFFIALFVFSCSNNEEDNNTPNVSIPEITTIPNPFYIITTSSASAGGNFISDGGSQITVAGLVWSTSPNPTTALATKTTNNYSQGTVVVGSNFYNTMTGLSASTTYYVRAYATNSSGTAYGNEISFITQNNPPPVIQTKSVTDVTYNSAVTGGDVANNQPSPIIQKGVVWSLSPNPTITLSTKTIEGSGNTNFISNITNLNPESIYYVRAYATNNYGTSYGGELTIRTYVGDIDGNSYDTTLICNQKWITRNLDVSKYTDGTPLVQATASNYNSLTVGAWIYYPSGLGTGFGKLYNWYAVAGIYDAASLANPALRKKLAPEGWHIPSLTEWNTLRDCLGGQTVAGGKLKTTGTSNWFSPNTGATNSSGFNGLPGGYYPNGFEVPAQIGYGAYFWSTTEYSGSISSAQGISILAANAYFNLRNSIGKYNLYSVRCVKN